jgi:hypothetical protein
MVFSKPLREGIRRGRIKCSVRVWIRPHVKVGGRYPFEDGHIVVDSITAIDLSDVTDDLARESGFATVQDLIDVARHGKGENIYLVRFHYVRPGGWDEQPEATAAAGSRPRQVGPASPSSSRTLLQRIRSTTPPAAPRAKAAGGTSARKSRARDR